MRTVTLLLVLCATMVACSSHRVYTPPPYIGAYLQTGHSMTIAVLPPFAPEHPISPDYLSNNVAALFLPACGSVVPEGLVPSRDEALALAKRNNSEYLVLLELDKWSSGAVSGIHVILRVNLITVEGEKLVADRVFQPKKSGLAIGISYSTKDPWDYVKGDMQEWLTKIVFYNAPGNGQAGGTSGGRILPRSTP